MYAHNKRLTAMTVDQFIALGTTLGMEAAYYGSTTDGEDSVKHYLIPLDGEYVEPEPGTILSLHIGGRVVGGWSAEGWWLSGQCPGLITPGESWNLTCGDWHWALSS